MKLKNIGEKVISVGETIIVPGAEAEVGETWRKNDIIAFFVERGYLEILDKAPKSGSAKK